MSFFTRALVRSPSRNFSAGLTTVDLGAPDYATAIEQHVEYCDALRSCGLTLVDLQVLDEYPDSTFVEDTAILTNRCAVITRPGAETRRGEVSSIETDLLNWFDEVARIQLPGTVDGGDVCEVENHFLIGISDRTNESGALQLAHILRAHDYTAELLDIRNVKGILHLKSGISYLGEDRMVIINALASLEPIREYELIRVAPGEEYAANCVRVNDSVLIAAGFPILADALNRLGHKTTALRMSEFQKMDGGLSCLSLRF